ncbi:bifunctional riboflavin kinase/FAD synthetase [Kovacikia minuta]|uniref:bifunctional riboflavin kinase/FAD synthetase n=1 Tax=Kovacikia minuta TaxID=2931930 RepID=UPI0020C76877
MFLGGDEGFVSDKKFYATVVTFHPHPQEFFSGQPRSLLTPLAEKGALLKAMGIEQLVLLPFNHELAALTPEQFVEKILLQSLQAKKVSVGLDFCFGHRRAGTASDLRAIAATYGIEVTIAPLKNLEGERISSSAIRKALQAGDLQSANCLLGRSYSLVGKVCEGQQLGRTLGFPTANLQLPPEKFLPRSGVYAVQVHICEKTDSCNLLTEPKLLGVMNIGFRPTLDGTTQVIEVHLLDWAGDLYGRTLVVHLAEFLRPEQKFASLDVLKAQIQADCVAAKAILTKDQSASLPPGNSEPG